MENNHPISEILNVSLDNLKGLVDSNTVIGDPIVVQDVTIIPISKVSFGFATGGSELPTKKPNTPFGGGSGGGVTITPVCFLTVSHGEVRMVQPQTADNTADRIVNAVPDLLDRIATLAGKKTPKDEPAEPVEPEEQA
jgi:sporulation protein YtfJ